MSQIKFICSCCGQEIEGIPDLAFKEPLPYFELNEEERTSKAKLSDDLCNVGERYFIRAVCEIPINGTEEFYGYGIWVTLSETNFRRYVETFSDNDQSKLGGMFGWFSNRLPGYPDTFNLKTTVVPRDKNRRPLVWINDDHSDHQLFNEQRNGISPERLGEIYALNSCQNAMD